MPDGEHLVFTARVAPEVDFFLPRARTALRLAARLALGDARVAAWDAHVARLAAKLGARCSGLRDGGASRSRLGDCAGAAALRLCARAEEVGEELTASV